MGWTNPDTAVSVQHPELVLLFKAAAPRPRDENDLGHVIGLLSHRQRSWLHHAIELAHPDSTWIHRL